MALTLILRFLLTCGVEALIDFQHHIFERREPRKKAGRLEHNSSVWTQVVELSAFEEPSANDWIQYCLHRQGGRFAATRVIDEKDEFAFLDLEIEVFDDDCRSFGRRVDFSEYGEFDECAHAVTSESSLFFLICRLGARFGVKEPGEWGR